MNNDNNESNNLKELNEKSSLKTVFNSWIESLRQWLREAIA